jgi:hypothetical protein
MPSWLSMVFKRFLANIGTTSGLPSFMFLTCKQGYYVTDFFSRLFFLPLSCLAIFLAVSAKDVYNVCTFFGHSAYLVHFLLVDTGVHGSAG